MSESLRDTISKAYDEVTQEAPETGVQEATIPAPAEEKQVEVKTGRTEGRARDDKGRLLPGKAEKKEESQAAPTEPVAPIKPRPPRPSSWKKEMWESYDKLDPSVAEYIVQRENEYAKGVSTYKNEWDQVRPIAEVMAKFAPDLQQHNIKPEVWIENLGNAHRILATGQPAQKLSAFMKLANDYQIPVQDLFVQGQDGKIYYNPQVQNYQPQAPQPQVDVASEVRKVLLEQSTANEIQNFATATDDKGQLKHPHFEAVRATMQGLLQAELATDLTDAYKQALQHPRHSDIYAAIREQEQKAEAERKAQEQKDAVARARQKVISPKTSTPSAPDTGKTKGVRAAVEAAVEQHLGGGRV